MKFYSLGLVQLFSYHHLNLALAENNENFDLRSEILKLKNTVVDLKLENSDLKH